MNTLAQRTYNKVYYTFYILLLFFPAALSSLYGLPDPKLAVSVLCTELTPNHSDNLWDDDYSSKCIPSKHTIQRVRGW